MRVSIPVSFRGWPPIMTSLLHEVELAIVIGKEGRDLPISSAESYIAGYGKLDPVLSHLFDELNSSMPQPSH